MFKRSTSPHSSVVVTLKKKFDYTLLFCVIGLVIMGLIMVYDASVVQAFKDFGDKYYYIKQQLIWVLFGFCSLWFFSMFNYHNLKRLALPLFVISLALLLAVFIPGFGFSAGGAHRWLRLGIFSIQPAEIIKLSTIIFFAALFENKHRLTPFLSIVCIVSIIIGLFQKDLGSTLVFLATSLAMYIYAGAPILYFIFLMPVFLIGVMTFILTSSYRKQRILAFLQPFSDPQGYSYHISQVLIALGSGSWFGLGIGQSRQKFEYIPEVSTDSIFAIVGEELGFVGAVVLISLIAFCIFKGFKISEQAGDNFGGILAFGLVSWIATQSIVNLAAMVSLIPLTGVPLPFISYGGSALMANLTAIGILLNISKSTKV